MSAIIRNFVFPLAVVAAVGINMALHAPLWLALIFGVAAGRIARVLVDRWGETDHG